MTKNEIKIGTRLYHAMFGWCKVTAPVLKDKVLVDLEADELEYYVMGRGYVKYKRPGKNQPNILYTPITDLLNSPEEMTDILRLGKLTLNPTVKFWDKK